MSGSTRSGLVPTPKRSIRLLKRRKVPEDKRMPLHFEALPMPLSLRPFGGLFNPFAKGCSVLCNHPAPTAVKDVINQLKTSLTIEGRNAHIAKDKAAAAASQADQQQQQHHQHHHHHETDNIPEDLFRRYTDTDSRPLTPTPTVTSVTTGSFLNRRCITPEWGKNENIKRKKIILDLRRSHSQETLYWKPSSDITQSGLDDDKKKPKSAGANDDKKARRQKPDEHRPKSSLAVGLNQQQHGKATDARDDEGSIAKKMPVITCINEHDFDDEDVRRGKKRKKLKPAPTTTTFHLSEDPETQVAALGPDSLNPSTRPSLIPNTVSLLPNKEKRESDPVLLKGSFLTDEAFQALKTELDVDTIENTFGRYLNRALREAIKYMPSKPRNDLTTQKQGIEDPDKFLSPGESSKMPRKFSKSATRFDVPLDLALLETMTPWDYLSKHVWVSQQRKQLYKRVFLKYLNKCEEVDMDLANDGFNDNNTTDEPMPRTEYIERTMKWQSLPKALEDVLEFQGTERNVSEVLRLLDYDVTKPKDLVFRVWCGIVSFAERLALADPECTDSCDELEKADFTSMEQLLHEYKAPSKLLEIFEIIRRTHNVKYLK